MLSLLFCADTNWHEKCYFKCFADKSEFQSYVSATGVLIEPCPIYVKHDKAWRSNPAKTWTRAIGFQYESSIFPLLLVWYTWVQVSYPFFCWTPPYSSSWAPRISQRFAQSFLRQQEMDKSPCGKNGDRTPIPEWRRRGSGHGVLRTPFILHTMALI